MAPRFEDLIEQHHDEIFAYLWRLIGNERQSDVALEVEDLTQEVFLRAFENFLRLRRDSNYRAWLYKIATNCAYAKLRQSKNRREKNLTFKIIETDTTTSPVNESMQKRLPALVDALPAKQRACLTMRYLQDLDYSEIGLILDCTEESARANVYQAIRRLRAALEEDI
jgi:RNA polymerase sigma-70 factor (ECF subfamily)